MKLVILVVSAVAATVLSACAQPSPTPSANGTATPSATPAPSPTNPRPSLTTTPAPSLTSTPTKPPTSTTKPPPPPTSTAPFPPSYLGQDLTRIPTSQKIVALTFDAGANADGLASILATLAAEHVTGTFFLTGNFAQSFPTQSHSIVTAGHRLGNHSVTHPHFPQLSAAQLRAEVLDADQQIRTSAGASPRPFFRFPFGDRNAATIDAVNDLGYLAVRWTVDTLGWQGTSGGRSAASVTQRVLDAAQPGEIVLMHVGSNPTDHSTLDADALPAMIAGLRARGYTFVTLNVLLT